MATQRRVFTYIYHQESKQQPLRTIVWSRVALWLCSPFASDIDETETTNAEFALFVKVLDSALTLPYAHLHSGNELHHQRREARVVVCVLYAAAEGGGGGEGDAACEGRALVRTPLCAPRRR